MAAWAFCQRSEVACHCERSEASCHCERSEAIPVSVSAFLGIASLRSQ
jgi:hypothetical protein